jgi:hypothetical protein
VRGSLSRLAPASWRGIRLAADLEQDFARLLGWGASPPSCSRSAHPAWGASRGPLFHPEGERERRSFFFRFREIHRLEGKRKRTSRPLPFLFRGTSDLLEDLGEIASFLLEEGVEGG